MSAQPQESGLAHVMTLADRRASMRLPLEERRKRLAQQADQMVGHYNLDSEVEEREVWQGGDIVEP